tara:strand:- start:365 stop:565 length:201 start_codon:yes stop_codon:yes gene_type:complete
MKKLLKKIKSIADKYYGGHFTILHFSTNVKFAFGTVTDREEIQNLTAYTNIEDALENGIQEHFLNH